MKLKLKKGASKKPALKKSGDEFEDMTREELKKYISANELDISVKKSMSDDDIRELIREQVGEENDTPEKEESNDEDEEGESEEGQSSWFSIGDDEDEDYQDTRTAWRFRLKPGEEKMITFLTPKAVTFREHTFKANGKIENATCKATTGERCPLCARDNKSYFAKAFFIVDHTEFTRQDGTKGKDSVRLIVMKKQSYDVLRDALIEHFGSAKDVKLEGLKIKVKRSKNSMSPNTGDSFYPQAHIKIKPEWKKTIANVEEAIKPLNRKQLLRKANIMEENTFDNDEA